MDKSSFFFTANCGVCHPGGAAMQYDRTGAPYFDRSTGLYGYGGGVASLPAAAQLDGDYGFINPSTGIPGTAGWSKTGVSEPDCLMCHLNQYATAPGSSDQHRGLSWHKRSGTLRGTGVAGVANFEWAPTAGAGWANVTYVAGQSPPMASAVTIDYALGLAAGTLVDQGGYLAIPVGKIGAARDANCRGCHAIPDGKKSGRTLLPTTDVHTQRGVGCTRCHTTPNEGVLDANGVAMANPHQIGKGDITIGAVRNDLDGTVESCADCHLGGADPIAPDPTARHLAIPDFHFSFMKCQVCHIRHLDDDPVSPTQDIPELVIEMSSNGTQNVSIWSAYLRTDPLDPTKDLTGWAPPYTSATGSRPFRWYPAVRWYKGKLQTVKPLYTSWFGEWLAGTGDAASIRPIPLRLVRKALTNGYAAGTARLAGLTLTPGTQVASGAPILHKKAEIRAFLMALRDATDAANPDTTANDIVVRPVLVRAEKVYYLNASDEVEYFESVVGESHDFAVNHNVVTPRDPLDPIVNPGPWGAGGCNDCHGPSSPFFYGKQLAEPAQYDYLDDKGSVPNPDAGKPRYVSHYEMMGLSQVRADELTGTSVPVVVMVDGPGKVTFGDSSTVCSERDGGCKISAKPGSTVAFTATPAAGMQFLGWTGCTPGNEPACTVAVGTPTSGLGNSGVTVRARFGAATYPLTLQLSGKGSVSGVTWASCSATECTGTVASGTSVVLSATSDAGFVFGGWGIQCLGTGTCSFPMNSARTVRANFAPASYTLSTSVVGAGGTVSDGGAISCVAGASTGCAGSFANGSAVTLTASWDPGAVLFTGWFGGVCTGTSATCKVTMNSSKSVTALFAPANYTLSVNTSGSGAGTVSDPDGIACTTGSTAGCSALEPNGRIVTLTAAEAAGSILTGWFGCSSWSGKTCNVVMTSARSVTARFEPATYPLTLLRSGKGSVSGVTWTSCSATECTGVVANGTSVVLSATPDAGFVFGGWGIQCLGTGTCSFPMNSAKTVRATFAAQ